MSHGGAAFIDVISPCVAFNNHPGSTKSYDYVREHNEAVSRIDFIRTREEITGDIAPGEVVDVRQHDGTLLRLRSLHADYDPTDRYAAMAYMQRTRRDGRGGDGPAVRRPAGHRPAHRAEHDRPSAQRAGCGPALPGRECARTAQRSLALSAGRRHHSRYFRRAHHGRTHRFPVHLARSTSSAWARRPACATPPA
jgi:hypothetical protein